MKKSIILAAFIVVGTTVSFAQTKTSVGPTGVTINTEYLQPIEYTSQAQLEELALPRIVVLKAELAKENISTEQAISLTELLWRFENAVVVEKNDKK